MLLPEACLEGAQQEHRPGEGPGGSRGRAPARHRRPRRADGAGAIGGAGNTSVGLDGRRLGAPGQDHHGPGSGRRRRVGRRDRGGAGDARAAAAGRPDGIRQDLRRQGASCRGAAQAEGGMAGGEGIHQGHRRRDGIGRSRQIRFHHQEVEARRQDPGRLPAQPTGRDGGGGLLDAGAARRGRFRAPHLGGARSRRRSRLLHRGEHADAPCVAARRSLGGIPGRRRSHRGAEGPPAKGRLRRQRVIADCSISIPKRRSA